MQKMDWFEAVQYMRDYNHRNKILAKGQNGPTCIMVAVITEDSFTEKYSLESRSYRFTNNEKAFISGMGGYSIFSANLDGTDPCVRLEQYLKDEGVPDGWEVDYVYIERED